MYIDAVGFIHVISQLKKKIKNGSLTIRNHINKAEQFQLNKFFISRPLQFYKKLDGMTKKKNLSPETKAATNCWSTIWGVPSTHNNDARWLQSVKNNYRTLKNKGTLIFFLDSTKRKID